MRFLLPGGSGYVGGRLAQFLKSRGHYVHVTTRRPLDSIPKWLQADQVTQFDPGLPESLVPLLDGIDVLVYLAAPDRDAAAKNPVRALKFGAELTWRLMEALRTHSRPPAVIYLSSFHVYGLNLRGQVTETTLPIPAHPYALSKRFAEEVIQAVRARLKAPALCIRLSNAFGYPAGVEITQWSLVFNDLCRQAAASRAVALHSSGVQRRNFIALGDVVRAIEFLAGRHAEWPADGIIHLGSRLCFSMREVAGIVADRAEVVLGFRPRLIIPENAPVESSEDMNFSLQRMTSLGFKWADDLNSEVDGTLRLSAAARHLEL